MFVGFIAVVVILLIIVGLMSTGATSGSGGVDQTKATKAISEISALAQSTGFFKTTTDNSNYEGLTVDTLENNGIISKADTVAISAGDYNIEALQDNSASISDGDKVVVSKAVPGLVYKVVADHALASDAAVNNTYFDISIAANKTADNGLTASLMQALDTAYAKVSANVDGNATSLVGADGAIVGEKAGDDVLNANWGKAGGAVADGAAIIVFN